MLIGLPPHLVFVTTKVIPQQRPMPGAECKEKNLPKFFKVSAFSGRVSERIFFRAAIVRQPPLADNKALTKTK